MALARLACPTYFEWVASRCNAADGPSRWGSDCAWCKAHGIPVRTLAIPKLSAFFSALADSYLHAI
eukprot:2229289-Karenia_brevis.AAC.1